MSTNLITSTYQRQKQACSIKDQAISFLPEITDIEACKVVSKDFFLTHAMIEKQLWENHWQRANKHLELFSTLCTEKKNNLTYASVSKVDINKITQRITTIPFTERLSQSPILRYAFIHLDSHHFEPSEFSSLITNLFSLDSIILSLPEEQQRFYLCHEKQLFDILIKAHSQATRLIQVDDIFIRSIDLISIVVTNLGGNTSALMKRAQRVRSKIQEPRELEMLKSLASEHHISPHQYLTDLIAHSKLTEQTTIGSLIQDEESKRVKAQQKAILEEEELKEKQRAEQTQKSKSLKGKPSQKQERPDATRREKSSKALSSPTTPKPKSSLFSQRKISSPQDDDDESGGKWSSVPYRSDQARSSFQINQYSYESLPCLSLSDRVRRWIRVETSAVREFPDESNTGTLRYSGHSDQALLEQIVFHNPTPIIKLLNHSVFQRRYLNKTERGFIAPVELTTDVPGGSMQRSKTVASIGVDQKSNLLYHFFIHPEKELAEMDLKQKVLNVLFGSKTAPEAESSARKESSLPGLSQSTVRLDRKDEANPEITVSYSICNPMNLEQQIQCSLTFFPIQR